MSTNDAQQLAFDGMAPRKRRKRAPAEKIVAAEDPIAQVVLDVQATHLGQTFDYLVDERWSQTARPGVMVRVRFGGRLLNGVIWKRTAASATPRSALRFLERVISPHVLVSESMRDDITRRRLWRHAGQHTSPGGPPARGAHRRRTATGRAFAMGGKAQILARLGRTDATVLRHDTGFI